MKCLFTLTMMLFCCNVSAQQPTPTPQTKSSTTITGQVIGADGKPVKNAAVSAYAFGSRNQRPQRTATNEDGAFRITDLKPGAYQLQAFLPGYVTEAIDLRKIYLGEFATLRLVKGGVVTGKVTDANGEPIPGMFVKLVNTKSGRSNDYRRTDDRGVYRIFGIPAGSYVVLADGIDFGWSWMNSDYEENIPTYYPSATRDTALELTINHGDELSGIDIRYRGERGYRVSGKLTGAIESRNNISVSVRYPASGNAVATTYIYDHKQGAPFELRGVPNGEYDLIAESKLGIDAGAAATPRRVIVAGTDVTGIELKLMPLSSLVGRIVLEELKASERPPTCEIKRNAIIPETVITARFDEERRVQPQTTVPGAQGEFKLNNLDPGRYRLNFDLPSEDWYVRAMTLPADATTKKSIDAALSGIALRSGETSKLVTITLNKGAAGLKGTIAASQPMRVFLVPMEKEFAADVLRYAEAIPERDGAFVFKHLAPGKYWVIARPFRESNRPVALDSTARAELRQAAEAENQTIQLQPCQRMVDYKLNLTAK